MSTITKPTRKVAKLIQAQVGNLNRIIHTRNLYDSRGFRYIDARAGNNVVTVRNLHTDAVIPFMDGVFHDGYNRPVNFADIHPSNQ